MPVCSLTVAMLVSSAVLNVTGVTLLRYASTSGNGIAAVCGCLCWAATSAVFLGLLNTGQKIAILSTLTASLGFLAVIVVGLFFGETLSHRQVAAIGLLIIGMALLSLP